MLKIQSVENLQTKYHVEVKLEKRIGRIQIKGIPEYVHDAADELHKILREAERVKQTRQKAALISDLVQWFCIDVQGGGSKLEEYPKPINSLLEEAYRNQQPRVEFFDNKKTKFIIDLQNFEEFPEDDPSSVAKVIRRNKMESKYL